MKVKVEKEIEKELTEKIEENKAQKPESIDNVIDRYVVDIPKTAVKEDLLKLIAEKEREYI